MIETYDLQLITRGEGDIRDITEEVQNIVRKSKVKNGFALVFVLSSTSGLAFMESEDGLTKDLLSTMERIAPKNANYEHEKAWHDGNGHSHMRATILGQSLSVPISQGEPLLGTWQQIIFVEFDIRQRNRKIIVQIYGE